MGRFVFQYSERMTQDTLLGWSQLVVNPNIILFSFNYIFLCENYRASFMISNCRNLL